MTDDLAKAVVDAWRNEGRSPAYHRAQKAALLRTWPTLYRAVDALEKEARRG